MGKLDEINAEYKKKMGYSQCPGEGLHGEASKSLSANKESHKVPLSKRGIQEEFPAPSHIKSPPAALCQSGGVLFADRL